MEKLGIPLGADHGMEDHILTNSGQSRSVLQPSDITKATDTAIKVYQATAFLIGSDHYWCDKFIEELKNDYVTGVEKYPKTLQESLHILQHYNFDLWNYQSPIKNTSWGMAFINSRHEIKKDATKFTFWNCQKKAIIQMNV